MKMVKHAMFCPNCGHLGIWQDKDDAGDYYAGTPMWCFACERELPDIHVKDPKDPRQGEHGARFWGARYDELRAAAIATGEIL